MVEKKENLQDTYTPGEYDPALYKYAHIAESVDGFENVSDEHIAQFHAQGFLPIQSAYSSAQVNDGMAAVKELIAGQNREFRGVQFERGRDKQVKRSEGHARELLVRKLTRFVGFDPRLNAFGEDPQLIDILTRIMGEPPKLFANQAMLKPPGIGREKTLAPGPTPTLTCPCTPASSARGLPSIPRIPKMDACTSSPKAIEQVPSYISKDATGKSATPTSCATTSPQ